MPRLPIITVPNPHLREVSKPVKSLDTKTVQFIKDLEESLHKSPISGVGISAIQVDVPLRIFLTTFPQDHTIPFDKWNKAKPGVQTFINPVIVAHSKEIYLGDDKKSRQMEGCLSIPKVWGYVWRYQWIEIEYQELIVPGSKSNSNPGINFSTRKVTRFSDFAGRVIQHEYDHLDGILFTDHLLGKSPIKGFEPLKLHSNHLFFDIEDEFTPIKNPEAFAQW